MSYRSNLLLMVMTHGRKDTIEQTIESAEKMLNWQFAWRKIINDYPDSEYHSWLLDKFSDRYEIDTTDGPRGLCGSIRRAWEGIKGTPIPIDYIFHLEDDYIFNEKIDIQKMINIIWLNPRLAQVSLLRQAWNAEEKHAGGIIQLHPNDFIQRESNSHLWLEHGRYFSFNPCLYPLHITRIPFPEEEYCEGKFAIFLRDELGYRFGILGRKNQLPKVTHIGIGRGPNWRWS